VDDQLEDRFDGFARGLSELSSSPLDSEDRALVEDLQASLEDLRNLVQSTAGKQTQDRSPADFSKFVSGGFLQMDDECRILAASHGVEQIFEASPDQLRGESLLSFLKNQGRERFESLVTHVLQRGESQGGEFQFHVDGKDITLVMAVDLVAPEIAPSAQFIDNGEGALLNVQILDITERRQLEDTLLRRNRELEMLVQTSQTFVENLDLDEVLVKILDELRSMLGVAGSLWLLDHVSGELVCRQASTPGQDEVVGWRLKPGEGIAGWVAENNQSIITPDAREDERHFVDVSQETGIEVRSLLCVPLRYKDEVIGVIQVMDEQVNSYSEDDLALLEALAGSAAIVIENARLFEKARNRMEKLSLLREIDQTFSTNLKLKTTVEALFDHLHEQLRVDGSVMWIYDQARNRLYYLESRGFPYSFHEIFQAPENNSLAEHVLKASRGLFLRDLDKREEETGFISDVNDLGYSAYCGLPLRTDNHVVGVLELLFQQSFRPDPEWLNFIETLASQAAIGIDRIRLFRELEMSNVKLVQAYDATIRGWARALELRDVGTEGHSRRVAQMTVELARKMGVSEEQLVHVRRGAFLHDIGKMGIPDDILKKPGELDEEEWNIMRQHPTHAFEMLADVDYLRPALEIPACHHAHWNGEGYPQGLSGKDIPLSARIFSVVDVWDALCSDRPYRKAWSKEKAIAYIKYQSGKQFDPRVVEHFLEYIGYQEEQKSGSEQQ